MKSMSEAGYFSTEFPQQCSEGTLEFCGCQGPLPPGVEGAEWQDSGLAVPTLLRLLGFPYVHRWDFWGELQLEKVPCLNFHNHCLAVRYRMHDRALASRDLGMRLHSAPCSGCSENSSYWRVTSCLKQTVITADKCLGIGGGINSALNKGNQE